MITNKDVISKLNELKYRKLAESYAKVYTIKPTDNLSFNEIFMKMLSYEDDLQKTNKINALLKQTNLAIPTSLDDIEYNNSRNLKRPLIEQLRTLDFIKNAHNVIVTGATGCGKSFISSSLGFEAVKTAYNCLYYRLPILLDDISIRRDKGIYQKLLKKLKTVDLLIIDDLGLANISIQETRELLEILEHRNTRKSTILVSQLPFKKWYDMFKDPTLADAIIDRIAYNSYIIELEGESMRKIKNKI